MNSHNLNSIVTVIEGFGLSEVLPRATDNRCVNFKGVDNITLTLIITVKGYRLMFCSKYVPYTSLYVEIFNNGSTYEYDIEKVQRYLTAILKYHINLAEIELIEEELRELATL